MILLLLENLGKFLMEWASRQRHDDRFILEDIRRSWETRPLRRSVGRS